VIRDLKHHLFRLQPHKGKLIGLALGLAGGFWGMIAGLSAGAAYDAWRDYVTNLRQPVLKPRSAMMPEDTATVLAVVALARTYELPGLARPGQALGVLKTYFAADQGTLRYIGKLLAMPQEHAPGAASQLTQLREALQGDAEKRKHVMQALLGLAQDGLPLDAATYALLEKTGQELGLAPVDFQVLAGPPPDAAQENPFDILGLPRDADEGAIIDAYRRLMRETHPDRQMKRSGMTLARAEARAARLNAAYARLRKNPGS
jgi:DnaJ like chaperone protein